MAKAVNVGNLIVGGENPVWIQSMTTTDTLDAAATKAQVDALAKAGCDLVRIAVSSIDEVNACRNFLSCTSVPLVADIQFDYRLAIACADAGFSKIRFNPGNIGSDSRVAEVAAACKRNRVPIRIGVNSGSLEKEAEASYGRTAEALAESALKHVALLEKHGFYEIIISAKASDVKMTVKANRILAEKSDYPLHLGVTESGSREYGLVKSAVGIGSLLADGIGDTVRVSLTGDPIQEISAAKMILKATGRYLKGCEIISCPTCSRCKYDITNILDDITSYVKNIDTPLKIAVMGCAVNGPGEAKDADLGVAGGKEKSVIFKKGQIFKTVDNASVAAELKTIIDGLCKKP